MKANGRGLAVVLIVLFAWTNQAVASDHKKTCKHLGKMYMTAASLRDKGADRDMVFSQLRIMGDQLPGYFIDDEQVFNIAEQVYYSAEFAEQEGEAFGRAIERQCINGQIVDVFVRR